MVKRDSGTRSSRPPGPVGSLLTGNLRAYEEDRLGFLMDVRRYGSLASFDARTTVVNDPHLALQILRDRDRLWDVSHDLLGRRLDQAESEDIVAVRPLLGPGMRASAVVGFTTHVLRLTHERLADVRNDSPVVLDPLTFAESVISEAVGRHVLGAAYDDLGHLVADLLDALEEVIGNVLALPPAFGTPARRRIARRYERLRAGVASLIGCADASLRVPAPADPEPRPLVSLVAAHTPTGVDRRADLLIGALLAAQRVPAAAAGWVLMLLADHGEAQSQVRAEAVKARAPHADGALARQGRSPFTRATVLEALRLYPPTWLISRVARRRVHLGAYEFRAGHTFVLSPYVLHRDPSLYENPCSFVPQRWLGRTPASRHYLAFGAGLHRCPGTDASLACLVGLVGALTETNVLTRVGTVRADTRTSLRPEGIGICLAPIVSDLTVRSAASTTRREVRSLTNA